MKVFVEEQRKSTRFLIIMITLTVLIAVVPFVVGLETFPEFDSEGFLVLTIIAIIMILSILFILSIKLSTKIDELGIHYKFFPFNKKEKLIKWSEIKSCYISRYRPIQDFGGYGFRSRNFFKKNGMALTLYGNKGIQIELKNGKKILIGTQKEDEVKRVLQTYYDKFVNSI